MKAEERHELQQNDLESFLYYRLPHYLRQYGSYILLVLALAFLGFQLWKMHDQKKQAHVQAAWAAYFDAKNKTTLVEEIGPDGKKTGRLVPVTTPRVLDSKLPVPPHDPKVAIENPVEILNEIAQTYSDVPAVAGKANVTLGMYYKDLVVDGNMPVGGVVTSREDAIRLARERFEYVISSYADQPDLVAEAKLGLAALYETESKFDDAQKVYESFTDKSSFYAGSTYAMEAARKLARLPEVKKESKFGPVGIWPRPEATVSDTQATRPTSTPGTAATLPVEVPAATAPTATVPAKTAPAATATKPRDLY